MSSSPYSWPAVGAVTLPLVGGHISGYIGRENYGAWYDSLKKPDWRPPNVAFPIVWTSLYAGMGYASYLVWKEGGGFSVVWTSLYAGMGYASYLVWKEGGGFSGPGKWALAAYGGQLALNFAWSPIFFGQKSIKGGLIDIALLDVAAVGTTFLFYKVHPMASYIMIPYLAWLALATALNLRIYKDNPELKDE